MLFLTVLIVWFIWIFFRFLHRDDICSEVFPSIYYIISIVDGINFMDCFRKLTFIFFVIGLWFDSKPNKVANFYFWTVYYSRPLNNVMKNGTMVFFVKCFGRYNQSESSDRSEMREDACFGFLAGGDFFGGLGN